jgi:CheY-like chemotaxis protein
VPQKVYTIQEAATVSGLTEKEIREAIINNLLVAQKSETLGDFVIAHDDLEMYLRLYKTGTRIAKKTRVLVVDDEFNFCRLLKLELERKNKMLEVKIATYGKDGIELAQKFKPHIILLDFMLPDITGEEVLKALTELKKNFGTRIVVYSVYAKDLIKESPRLTERLELLGAEEFIDKTKGMKQLTNKVNEIIKSE